jgi:hypothetical protein
MTWINFRIQTFNFKNEPVDDVVCSVWDSDELLERVFRDFGTNRLKKVVIEKVKKNP